VVQQLVGFVSTPQRRDLGVMTAVAAMLAFVPLTHSVFWGTLAYTLIGGTIADAVVTLVFLPAMYSICFRVRPHAQAAQGTRQL
jgi:Cu/Ag efflux pump CusA